jgi:hypothetical protein
VMEGDGVIAAWDSMIGPEAERLARAAESKRLRDEADRNVKVFTTDN